MNETSSRDEQAILALLEALERSETEASAPPAGAASRDGEAALTLERLYAETLGLLPYALDAEPPRPEVKARLMARIATTRVAAQAAAPAVVPIAGHRSPRKAAAAGAPAAPAGAPVRSWWTTIAAVFALAALGLAGWLAIELGQARSSLALLEHDRGVLIETLAGQEAQLADRGQMSDLIALISSPGAEVCPLRPVGEAPMAPQAHAVLYMAPGNRDWYLVASDLGESPDGVYKVWFYTPNGAVAAGVIDPAAATRLPISAYRLPIEGMQAVAVTLEPSADSPAPTGPLVLYGDERMAIL